MRKRRIISIIAAVIILPIIICAILISVPPSEVGSPVTFTSNDERVKLATGLNQRTMSFENALRNRRMNRASLDIDERELNAYIQSSPEIQKKIHDIGGKDVVVRLHKDRVVVGMRVPYKGAMFPASAIINVRQSLDGKLTINILSVKIGSLPAPASLVDKMINSSMKNGTVDLPPGVVNLEISEGKVIIQANPASIQPR